MQKFNFVVVVILAVFLAGCATSRAPALTPLEIQSLQTRQYDAGKDIVFPSVLSVFQDLGYIVKTADKDTGFITAEGASDTKHGFWGTAFSKQAAATAFVETIGKVTQVRLNIVIKKSSSTEYGKVTKDDTPILDAKIYQSAFERIENAIFIRSGS